MYKNSLIDYKSYSIENRIKFADIKSLEFMVVNGLFELLKWKLKSKQYIQIDLSGLKCLFSALSQVISSSKSSIKLTDISSNLQSLIVIGNNQIVNVNEKVNNKKRKHNDDEDDVEGDARMKDIIEESNSISTKSLLPLTTLFKDILLLLLKNKRVYCECLCQDLISLAIKSCCVTDYGAGIIEILSNLDQPLPIYQSTLDELENITIIDYRETLLNIILNSKSYKLYSSISKFKLPSLKSRPVVKYSPYQYTKKNFCYCDTYWKNLDEQYIQSLYSGHGRYLPYHSDYEVCEVRVRNNVIYDELYGDEYEYNNYTSTEEDYEEHKYYFQVANDNYRRYQILLLTDDPRVVGDMDQKFLSQYCSSKLSYNGIIYMLDHFDFGGVYYDIANQVDFRRFTIEKN